MTGSQCDSAAWDERAQQLAGVRRAGIVGGLIFSMGTFCVVLVELIVVAGLGVVGLLGGTAPSERSADANHIGASTLIAASLVIAGLLAISVAASALVVSSRILHSSGSPRPAAILPAAIGFSALPTAIFCVTAGAILSLSVWMTGRMEADSESLWLPAIGAILCLGVVDLIVTSLVAPYAFLRSARRFIGGTSADGPVSGWVGNRSGPPPERR